MQSAQAVINKSDLITNLAAVSEGLEEHTVDEAVRLIMAMMVDELVNDGRIEIRGFGSFCLHHRTARMARNPRTGEQVQVDAKAVPFFKPGKALREAVNAVND
ncbi:integration host factor subunit beta [Moraxella sp. FZLJ2107]|uniref:HU family DNA-binding protein n=1 Tax=unclassified Moraxella TaxID=2685852 RepID=UPI00209C34EA|nr:MULTISPECIES: HU family DNA-binding protein [unclassified Moraxella]USZ14567.1 integration host factor subunit beta [Moraxella sp. FZFQ2102]UTO05239.1 integration host factor subunit beta [Moraxella sp. FZLJ2107]UTO21974.1 integration host factor subunit beta [Moraxella sp. FZLJ2109]